MGCHGNGFQTSWLLLSVTWMILLLWIPHVNSQVQNCNDRSGMDGQESAGGSTSSGNEFVFPASVHLNRTWTAALADTSTTDYMLLRDFLYPKLYIIFSCKVSLIRIVFKRIENIRFELDGVHVVANYDVVLSENLELADDELSNAAIAELKLDPELRSSVIEAVVLSESDKSTFNTVMATIGAVAGILAVAATGYGLFKQIRSKLQMVGNKMKDTMEEGKDKMDATKNEMADKKDMAKDEGEGGMKCPDVCKNVTCPVKCKPVVCPPVVCPAVCKIGQCCPGMGEAAPNTTTSADPQGYRPPEPLLWMTDNTAAFPGNNAGIQSMMTSQPDNGAHVHQVVTSQYGSDVQLPRGVTSPQCNGVHLRHAHVHPTATSQNNNGTSVPAVTTLPNVSVMPTSANVPNYGNGSPMPGNVTSPYGNVIQMPTNMTSPYRSGSPVPTVMTSPYDRVVEIPPNMTSPYDNSAQAPPIIASQYPIPLPAPYMGGQSTPTYIVYST